MALNFFARFAPALKASADEEAELVDPQKTLRETCSKTEDCRVAKKKLDDCNDRVNSRKKTEETCAEEFYDFIHCIDHCASKHLFKYLK
ncbi:cytochrome b-c1 complex subunit 6, mitochondrial-like [Prorops nasuta]|uniref:cytochrome b-c1 complex subunit 6, mitochondrial-like n=1 Tax=Prorops nasuta TaxID=863751 RepID=UPI0034CDA07D